MTGTPRVAYVLTQDRGGPADLCVALAAELAASGAVEVRVFGPEPARGAERLAGLFEPMPVPSKLDTGAGRRLRDAVTAWRPDLVHAQDRRSGTVVAPMRGMPRLQTYHGVPEDVGQPWFDGERGAARPSRYSRATLAADALLARVLDRTVVPSPSMARFLRTRLRVPRQRLVHVDNGLALPPVPAPVAGRVRNLLFVGLLLERKGVLDLVTALSRPGVLPPDGTLTIAGDGPERAAVERAVAEGGLTGRVNLLGFRADVPMLMAAADAVVVPSRMEQQPLVVVEAMAAGRPVLATETGDVARMLDAPGAQRFLARPGDVDGLAARLRALFADPEPARTGALLAARAHELFDVVGAARSHLRLYASLTGREPADGVRRAAR